MKLTVTRLLSRREFLASFGSPEVPVMFEGALTDWPASRKWSFDWFRRAHGHTAVSLHPNLYVHGSVKGTAEVSPNRKASTIGRYVDGLTGRDDAEAGYLAGAEIYRAIPELRHDLRFPPYYSLERWAVPSFFMGGAGTVSQLHVDWAQNLHALFTGKKRWQMWAPRHSLALRPATFDWRFAISGCDMPADGDALGVSCPEPDLDFEMDAGNLLFVPYGWWHRVTTLEPAIAANLWWWSLPMVPRKGPRALATMARLKLARAIA